jgi:hypothetical protein
VAALLVGRSPERRSVGSSCPMSDEDLLTRVRNAGHSFRSLRADFRVWRHIERGAAAGGFDHDMRAALSAVLAPEAVEQQEQIRVWVVPPDRARIKRSGVRSGPALQVQARGRWWISDDSGSTGASGSTAGQDLLFEFNRLINPGPAFAGLDLISRSGGEHCGRPADVVHATPNLGWSDVPSSLGLRSLGLGASEYHLAIDREHGTLLRVEARHAGAPFYIIDAHDVAFDEELPSELFENNLAHPSNVDAGADHEAVPRRMELPDILERVDFALYTPAAVPEGWPMTSFLLSVPQEDDSWQAVLLAYAGEDRATALSILQTSPAAPVAFATGPHGPQAQTVEDHGATYTVRGPAPSWPHCEVTLERGDTRVTLISPRLSQAAMLRLAATLAPVSA